MKTTTFNYEYADKILKVLRRKMILSFNRMRSELSLASFDELDVLATVNKGYNEIYDDIIHYGTMIVKQYMNGMGIENRDWTSYVTMFLNRYNGVTQYKFSSEFERKKYRLAEALIALGNISSIPVAMKLLDKQIQQFGIDLTDHANIQAAIELGYTQARWITQADDRVCNECKSLNGKTFDINKVPDKPHYNCRCTLMFIKGAKSLNI